VRSCIDNAELLEAVGQELVYALPFTMIQRQSALPSLQGLLDSLDKHGESIGINSYGITDTSLEEIFLKIAHTEEYSGEQDRFMNGIIIITLFFISFKFIDSAAGKTNGSGKNGSSQNGNLAKNALNGKAHAVKSGNSSVSKQGKLLFCVSNFYCFNYLYASETVCFGCFCFKVKEGASTFNPTGAKFNVRASI